MIYAVIAAGGIGSRMGNVEKPKQYLKIKDKPIIAHTVEKFFVNDAFRKIIILTPAQWVNYTKELLAKYLPQNDKVVVVKGGDTRNETIMNAVRYIEENDGLDDDTADVFDATADMIDELEIDIPRYAVYTPFPGTDCYRRMAAENRLLPGVNWSWYDTQHVVIRPKQMTSEDLDAGFIRAWQRTFSMKSILRRLSLRRSQFPVAFIGNLAYRLYRRKLARDNHRFALSEEDVLR